MTSERMLPGRACETWRKLRLRTAPLALVSGLAFAAPARGEAPGALATQPAVVAAAAQQGPASAPEGASLREREGEEAARQGKTEAHEENSIWGLLGKIVNFALLAGGLIYLLRSPIGQYLTGRHAQIRNDLVTARRMKDESGAQIAEMQQKLERLPGELDALRTRGQQEIAAEEERIRRDAEAERERLLESMRREIDLQLRIARRDLLTHAADLAVQVARDRIGRQITTEDQQRLVDRYLEQVKQA